MPVWDYVSLTRPQKTNLHPHCNGEVGIVLPGALQGLDFGDLNLNVLRLVPLIFCLDAHQFTFYSFQSKSIKFGLLNHAHAQEAQD